MRPVNKSQTPAGFPYTLTTVVGSKSQKKSQLLSNLQSKNLLLGSQLTLQDCVNAWTRDVHDPSSGLLSKDDRDTITDIVTTNYKKAAQPLVQQLGSFCSYCETYIPGLIEVEHVCPKSELPAFSLAWDNFLLSCSPCNTSKGGSPNRAFAAGKVPAITGWSASYETQLMNAIRAEFVWPDTQPGSFQALRPMLMYSANGGWSSIESFQNNLSVDTKLKIVSQDYTNQETLADIPGIGVVPVCVELVARNAGSVTSTQAADMIQLLELNHGGRTVYDRRVMNRTAAWFAALISAEAWLSQEQFYYASPACPPGGQPYPDAIFDSWLQATVQAAASKGFFTVWINVLKSFSRINAPLTAKRQVATLADEFLGQILTAFPNTNLSQIP